MKRLFLELAVVVLCLGIAGCPKQVIHPGTANSFDSGAYDTILVTHKVIEDTKTQLASGAFQASLVPGIKSTLNGLIAVYNDADIFYCNPPANALPTDSCAADSYHAQAQAGTATAAQQATMQTKLTAVNDASKKLTSAKAGN